MSKFSYTVDTGVFWDDEQTGIVSVLKHSMLNVS